MKSTRLLAVGVLLAAAILLIGRLPPAASDDKISAKLSIPPAAQPAAGRFHMTAAAGQLFLLDTMTGQVWRHAPNSKSDEKFFEAKIQEAGLANLSKVLGPTYQSMPLSYWLVMLRDHDEEFRMKGLEAVVHFGSKAKAALPDLIEMLGKSFENDSINRVGEAVMIAIARVDPKRDFLRSQLKHANYEVRRSAALAITALGGVDPEEMPGNRQKVDTVSMGRGSVEFDADEETEAEKDPFKWRLPGDREAIPVLIEMLQDRQRMGDFTVQEAAMKALASYKADAAPAIPALQRMLTDKEAGVRAEAVKALVEIGPAAKGTIPTIRVGLKDPDVQVRAAAAFAIGKFGDRESLPALQKLLKDKSPAVRKSVVAAFGLLKSDARTTVPLLIEVAATPESKMLKINIVAGVADTSTDWNETAVRDEAIQSLGKLGTAARAAAPALIKLADKLPLAQRALRKVDPKEFEKFQKARNTR